MTAVGPGLQWLDRLSDAGDRAARTGDAAIDWGLRPAPPRWMPARSYITAISQLYYGEQATVRMCERLLRDIADASAARFIATQIADEKRHIGYYERYLGRLGAIGDIEEGVAMAYDGALGWSGSYHGAIVAFHVVLEGEGLRIQRLFGDWFPCPLFRQVNGLIARDEGRHVAFGRRYLKQSLASLPFEERLAIFRWIRALWFDCADAIRAEMPATVSLLVGRGWAEDRWRRQCRALRDIGLIGQDDAETFRHV